MADRAPGPASPADTVLLVEDNEANTMLALRQLETLGYAATAVSNGRDAVEAVVALEGAREAPYGLILMDCQMPEMDGFAATREIRRKQGRDGRRVPIIAMTANATEHDREACMAAGMDDYITKPVMIEALRAVLARWMPARGATERGPGPPTPTAASGRSSGMKRSSASWTSISQSCRGERMPSAAPPNRAPRRRSGWPPTR